MLGARTKPNRCFEAYSRHRPLRPGRSLAESRVPGASGTPGLFTAGCEAQAATGPLRGALSTPRVLSRTISGAETDKTDSLARHETPS